MLASIIMYMSNKSINRWFSAEKKKKAKMRDAKIPKRGEMVVRAIGIGSVHSCETGRKHLDNLLNVCSTRRKFSEQHVDSLT